MLAIFCEARKRLGKLPEEQKAAAPIWQQRRAKTSGFRIQKTTLKTTKLYSAQLKLNGKQRGKGKAIIL